MWVVTGAYLYAGDPCTLQGHGILLATAQTATHNHEVKVRRSQELADSKKEHGNALFRIQKYTEALACYSEAINICPDCAAYYSNRAAAYTMLHKYKEDRNAIRVIRVYMLSGEVLQLSNFLNFFHHRNETGSAFPIHDSVLDSELDKAETVLSQNTLNAIEAFYLSILDGHMSTIASQVEEHIAKAEANFEKKDYITAISSLDHCIEHCCAAMNFKVQKAEALALMGRYQEAQELANDILQKEAMNTGALYVKGMCLYHQDNAGMALKHFRRVLKQVPNHRKAKDIYKRAKTLAAKKEKGNKAFREGKYKNAHSLYSEALSIDPSNLSTNSKLFCNRATVSSK
ncbi:Dnaj homolog subfamily c member 7-like, partial [Plakobranchus ocellatus]